MKNLYFIIIIILSIQCSNPKTENIKNWKITALKNLPIKTTNQAVCEGFIDSKAFLYSFGGLDSTKQHSGIHNLSYRYNVEANSWEEISSIPDTLGKIASAASRINDTIYIIGGYHVFADGREKSSDKVHRFNIKNNSFFDDGTPIPIPIDDHVQAIWKDSLIYVVTGWSNVKNIPDVQIYNPSNNTWSIGSSIPNNNIYKSFGSSGTIIGDTIFYFGGASMGKNYPIQNYLRKGIINANKPTEITWTAKIIDTLVTGYRMAATEVNNMPFWIGGSTTTYNYNAIAYNKSGNVNPVNRSFYLKNGRLVTNFENKFPMDLRGIAEINDSVKYIVGGIEKNQKVSNKVYKIEWK